VPRFTLSASARPARSSKLAYNRRQAAQALGVSISTIDRRVVPTIDTVKTPWGQRLIPAAELERFLRSVLRSCARPPVERLTYTRTQAAETLGISRSTFNRRVLPYVEIVEMPWGTKLVPVDALERLIAERRRPPRERRRPSRPPGRPPSLAPHVVKRICAERAAGKSLAQIARDLNASRTPTAHSGVQWWPSTVRSILVRSDPHADPQASAKLLDLERSGTPHCPSASR
jgi:hypothetical protein